MGSVSLKVCSADFCICTIFELISSFDIFLSEPLQSIAESHLLGYDYGQRNGDIVSGRLNYQFYGLINFVSGQNLADCRDKSREFAHELLRCKQKFMLRGTWAIYLQAVAFIEGLDFTEKEDNPNELPTWENLAVGETGSHLDFSVGKLFNVVKNNDGASLS